ncbi:hypothetical protein ACWGFX_00890 [Streptomyces xanthophaeus]
MVNEPDTTPIHKQYAQRFSADLEINRKEQDELSAQIAELEARLKQLKADENWLCGVQGALPAAGAGKAAERVAAQAVRSPATKTAKTAAAPAASAAEPVAGSVPKPRQAKKAAGATRARKATPAKKASGTAATGTKAKAAPRKPATTAAKTATTAAPAAAGSTTTAATATTAAAAAAAKKDTGTKSPQAEPPLRELVLALLVGAAEPRLVSEVSTELAQAHPGRPASTQVVRNTLETLAKKNLIEKEHKQGSVMYSAPRPATTEPVTAAATATGTKDEKEPVKV